MSGRGAAGWAVRIVVAGVLLYGAWAKATAPMAGGSIYGSLAITWPAAGWAVVALEAGLGLWLISGLRRRWAAVATLLMLLAFSDVLAVELLHERPRPCGCFGETATLDPQTSGERDILRGLGRNAALAAALGWLVFSRDKTAGGKLERQHG